MRKIIGFLAALQINMLTKLNIIAKQRRCEFTKDIGRLEGSGLAQFLGRQEQPCLKLSNTMIYLYILSAIFLHGVFALFPWQRLRNSMVVIVEDANKFDMLLLKLALNFKVSIISFSIFTNVI